MRRLLPVLLALTLACGFFTPSAAPPPTPPHVPPVTATAAFTPAPAATATAVPSATPAPTATRVVFASPTVAASPTVDLDFHLAPEHVRFHPAPMLYSGDTVSVEVIAEGAPRNWEGAPVWLYAGARADPPLGEATFGRFGLGERMQATFTWVWDTRGLEGPQTLWVVVGPAPDAQPPLAEQSVRVTANLLPAAERPMPEPLVGWATAESACCVFHYLTGTAAERDMDAIRATADAAFARVETVLGIEQSGQTVFTLLSRLLGHGGFASSEISLTYMDRNPAGNDLFHLFAHEGTHLLDRNFAQLKPTLMTEGLAVYVAGGHFKSEDLEQRAAALLALDRYIPLAELADRFYPAQHEIGYLEGGAFITYLVHRFGWERFKTMYGSFESAPSEARMLDDGLQRHFGSSLAELEAAWLLHLSSVPRDQAEINDLRLTIHLYDTLRRYQQLKDPSAFFLTAWLPDGPRARDLAITADFVRHPATPDHIALETMLQAAGRRLTAGDAVGADELLGAVNAALDAGRLSASPLASEYLLVVNELLAGGYEAQTIDLEAASAEVTAIRDWPHLDELSLARAAGGWRITASVGQDGANGQGWAGFARPLWAGLFGRQVARADGIIWHWSN